MAEEIQKHQLLVKLLKMTTSNTDAEALVAIRKANELLTSAGWDWDRLMAGKITVVGDPFKGLSNPTPRIDPREEQRRREQAEADRQAEILRKTQAIIDAEKQKRLWEATAAKAAADLAAQVRPAPVKRTTHPIAKRSNQYEGACYCCGILVTKNAGFIFKPFEYHSRAPDDWRCICTTCNTSAIVGPAQAMRQGKGSRKVTADDIA